MVILMMVPGYPNIFFMGVLWGNQLIYRFFLSNFDLIRMCTLILFLHWNCLNMSQLFYWLTIQWLYHWISEMLARHSFCQKYLFAWFASKYIWRMLEYFWFLLTYASPTLKKHWCGLSFVLKVSFFNKW